MTMVQGAVPGVAPVGAVPPDTGSVPPVGGTLVSTALQIVKMFNEVLLAALVKYVVMLLLVYGAVSAYC